MSLVKAGRCWRTECPLFPSRGLGKPSPAEAGPGLPRLLRTKTTPSRASKSCISGNGARLKLRKLMLITGSHTVAALVRSLGVRVSASASGSDCPVNNDSYIVNRSSPFQLFPVIHCVSLCPAT